ncbi:MAG: hypothetical protein PUB75_00675 [Firmicutes bacterium]|nr:hypothetical protein [Bacillota bacterium]
MVRFQYRQKSRSGIKTVLAICVFLIVITVFFYGINSLSKTTETKEKESLENSLSRSITYCYATEGAYPENLDYIKDNYGLIYDETKFMVDYKVIGSNIYPDVTVIEIGKEK